MRGDDANPLPASEGDIVAEPASDATPATGMRAFFEKAWLNPVRVAAGVLGILVGILVLTASHPNHSLGVAVLALGAFILGHVGLERLFRSVATELTEPPEGGMRDFAASFIATSGVILGLLSVFGEKSLPETLKIGVVALVADILIGTVLVGLLLAGPSDSDQPAWNLLRCVFNLALWSLALGLLCVATSLLYR